MAHARAGLGPDAGGYHLVVGEDRAVEEQAGSAFKTRAQRRVDPRAAGHVEHRAATLAAGDAYARRVAAVRAEVGNRAVGLAAGLHVERDLAGHGEALDPHASSMAIRIADFELAGGKLAPRHDGPVDHVED